MTDNPQYPQYPGSSGGSGGSGGPGGPGDYPQQDPYQPPGQYPQYPQPGQYPQQGQYQQYPQGQYQYPGPYAQGPAAGRPERPKSVVNAVRLMYAGAALSAVNAVVGLFSKSAIRTAVLAHRGNLSLGQVNTAVNIGYGLIVVVGLIGVALWIWMAWANNGGKSWARVVATVFFGLFTLDLLYSVARGRTAAGGILGLVEWLVGLGAVLFMWQRSSSDYYNAVSNPTGYGPMR